ncbi:MAG: hypothetical protein NTZ25_01180 [Candidatus Peregrinibacteria bacterium]|nr:hypothetical protein [Candidatus Peregrinibacteria bacterium]
MKNENKDLVLNKNQLLTLRDLRLYSFNRGLPFVEEFYESLVKESFLTPLLIEGTEQYFSPHQLAVVARLKENIVVDNKLRYPKPVCWQGTGNDQHEVRAICWGSAYVPESDFKGIFDWIDCLTKFLKVIHSLPALSSYKIPEEKLGAFRDSANLCFDFSPVKDKECAKIIELFGLDADMLFQLRWGIGIFAYQIDPLEAWFYYLSKHSRRDKDKFKGEARLTQELYYIDQLIKDFMEVLFGPQKEIPVIMKEARGLGMRLDDEFIAGTDFGSLREGLNLFKEWCGMDKHKHYLIENIEAKIQDFAQSLTNFEKKFGNDFHIPNAIPFNPKKSSEWALKDLPAEYTKFFGKDPVTEEDVSDAVYDYLHYLNRSLSNMMSMVETKLDDEYNKLWNERNSLGQNRRWTKELDHELGEKIRKIEKTRNGFYEIENKSNRVLCYHCGDNPVRVFDRLNRPEDLLCDVCIQTTKQLALANNEAERKMFKKREMGRWVCDKCGTLLHKFSNRNTFIAEGKNGNTPVITLKYGSVEMVVRCRGTEHSECGYVNKRTFNFGWVK